ncbi:Transcriptional regulator of ribosomal biogenesis proteins [Phlyctochytrium bullatum]|nr:Transcriptional regulator of ribosomal biogenesis proteins [Phlyctochytrium bullatum]
MSSSSIDHKHPPSTTTTTSTTSTATTTFTTTAQRHATASSTRSQQRSASGTAARSPGLASSSSQQQPSSSSSSSSSSSASAAAASGSGLLTARSTTSPITQQQQVKKDLQLQQPTPLPSASSSPSQDLAQTLPQLAVSHQPSQQRWTAALGPLSPSLASMSVSPNPYSSAFAAWFPSSPTLASSSMAIDSAATPAGAHTSSSTTTTSTSSAFFASSPSASAAINIPFSSSATRRTRTPSATLLLHPSASLKDAFASSNATAALLGTSASSTTTTTAAMMMLNHASAGASPSCLSPLLSPREAAELSLREHQLEKDFCRDFSCCGLVLNDLHELVRHCEECHGGLAPMMGAAVKEEDEMEEEVVDEGDAMEGVAPGKPDAPADEGKRNAKQRTGRSAAAGVASSPDSASSRASSATAASRSSSAEAEDREDAAAEEQRLEQRPAARKTRAGKAAASTAVVAVQEDPDAGEATAREEDEDDEASTVVAIGVDDMEAAAAQLKLAEEEEAAALAAALGFEMDPAALAAAAAAAAVAGDPFAMDSASSAAMLALFPHLQGSPSTATIDPALDPVLTTATTQDTENRPLPGSSLLPRIASTSSAVMVDHLFGTGVSCDDTAVTVSLADIYCGKEVCASPTSVFGSGTVLKTEDTSIDAMAVDEDDATLGGRFSVDSSRVFVASKEDEDEEVDIEGDDDEPTHHHHFQHLRSSGIGSVSFDVTSATASHPSSPYSSTAWSSEEEDSDSDSDVDEQAAAASAARMGTSPATVAAVRRGGAAGRGRRRRRKASVASAVARKRAQAAAAAARAAAASSGVVKEEQSEQENQQAGPEPYRRRERLAASASRRYEYLRQYGGLPATITAVPSPQRRSGSVGRSAAGATQSGLLCKAVANSLEASGAASPQTGLAASGSSASALKTSKKSAERLVRATKKMRIGGDEPATPKLQQPKAGAAADGKATAPSIPSPPFSMMDSDTESVMSASSASLSGRLALAMSGAAGQAVPGMPLGAPTKGPGRKSAAATAAAAAAAAAAGMPGTPASSRKIGPIPRPPASLQQLTPQQLASARAKAEMLVARAVAGELAFNKEKLVQQLQNQQIILARERERKAMQAEQRRAEKMAAVAAALTGTAVPLPAVVPPGAGERVAEVVRGTVAPTTASSAAPSTSMLSAALAAVKPAADPMGVPASPTPGSASMAFYGSDGQAAQQQQKPAELDAMESALKLVRGRLATPGNSAKQAGVPVPTTSSKPSPMVFGSPMSLGGVQGASAAAASRGPSNSILAQALGLGGLVGGNCSSKGAAAAAAAAVGINGAGAASGQSTAAMDAETAQLADLLGLNDVNGLGSMDDLSSLAAPATGGLEIPGVGGAGLADPSTLMALLDDEEEDADDKPRYRLGSMRVADPETGEKKYVCPGCHKEYKNANGLKYHLNHVHPNGDGMPDGFLYGKKKREMEHAFKPFPCVVAGCGKRYKNLNGLKYHIIHSHTAMLPNANDLPPELLGPVPEAVVVGGGEEVVGVETLAAAAKAGAVAAAPPQPGPIVGGPHAAMYVHGGGLMHPHHQLQAAAAAMRGGNAGMSMETGFGGGFLFNEDLMMDL